MSAIREVRQFCGQHPEIRAHKELGKLLYEAENKFEKLQKAINEAREIIKNLRSVLPDSDEYEMDLSWDWAWNGLSSFGQELVKEKRELANIWLNANPEEK